MQTTKPDHPPKTVHVTVHNDDDGDTYHLNGKRNDTLASVIAKLYDKKLRRERQPDDRLTCERDGEDVFPSEALSISDYLERGHCPDLEWLFAGGTGGA